MVYVSRTLTETKQGYSNIERELLSIVFALQRFYHYVYGYTVTVQTVYKPLVSVWKKSIVCNSSRLQRLFLRLSQYDLNIEYLKRKENVVADALSRVSPQPAGEEGEDEQDLSQPTCSQKKFLLFLRELQISDALRRKILRTDASGSK